MEFKTSSPESFATQKETSRNDLEREPNRTSLPLGELLIRERHKPGTEAANDLGRILVEVPLRARETSISESNQNTSGDKSGEKKAVVMSHIELLQTAETIHFHGVSLKQMIELGQLDTTGLRRIVQEFLDGGDVDAVTAREVKEHELKYERDPELRKAAVRRPDSTAPQNSGKDTGAAAQSESDGTPETAAVSQSKESGRPAPDAATIRSLRFKQAAMISATIVAVAILILIAFSITS